MSNVSSFQPKGRLKTTDLLPSVTLTHLPSAWRQTPHTCPCGARALSTAQSPCADHQSAGESRFGISTNGTEPPEVSAVTMPRCSSLVL